MVKQQQRDSPPGFLESSILQTTLSMLDRSPRTFHSESQHTSPLPSTPEYPAQWYLRDSAMHYCPYHIKTCLGCDSISIDDQPVDMTDRYPKISRSSSVQGDVCSQRCSTTPSSGVLSLYSPKANRMQLKEEFLKLYFPAGVADNETDFMFSKFLSREILQPLGFSMDKAAEALALVLLGNYYGDARLICEAQSSYRAAVARLKFDLARPDAMYEDSVLGAIYLLGFCEAHRSLAPLGELSRAHHVGLRDILLARGPKTVYSRFAQLLIYNFRHVVAISGHTRRRKVPLAGKAWRQCSAVTDALTSALSEHLISTPAVFERADQAMKHPKETEGAISSVAMELASLERSSQFWLFQWYSSFPKQPFWQDNSTKFPHFDKHQANTPKVFRKALSFPSFSHASTQVSYWSNLLQTKQTMYQLNRACPEPIFPRPEATLASEANECADSICASIAWLTQPKYGFCGVSRILAPLYFAKTWYMLRADLEKVAWCERVDQSLRDTHSIVNFFQDHHLVDAAMRTPDGSSHARSEADAVLTAEAVSSDDNDNDDNERTLSPPP